MRLTRSLLLKAFLAPTFLAISCSTSVKSAGNAETVVTVTPDADARKLFGEAKSPSAQPTRSISATPTCGCIAGAIGLPINGQYWQVMHIDRNRRWGHPSLIRYIESLAHRAHEHGWNGLLIGDMSQPRGGPMTSGHASHQAGIDVDIWIDPMPDHVLTDEERNVKMSPSSVLKPGTNELNPEVWNESRAQFVRDAAQDPAVARIFVAPAIKLALSKTKDPDGKDTEWLRRLRPWWGHDDHIHVRLHCPQNESCVEQEPQPEGDGCGAELEEWLAKTAKPEASSSEDPNPTVPISKLPPECIEVLKAPARVDEH